MFPMPFHYVPSHQTSSRINRHLHNHNFSFKTFSTVSNSLFSQLFIFIFIFIIIFIIISIPLSYTLIMAGSSETNPNPPNPNSSSAKSGKRKDKQVQFAEEPPHSKRQRIQDDLSEYRFGPLEPISPAFEHRTPYLTNMIYVYLEILQKLGFDLTDILGKYMNWLGIQNDYNINVLRVIYQSLSAKVKRKEVSQKESLVARVDFLI